MIKESVKRHKNIKKIAEKFLSD